MYPKASKGHTVFEGRGQSTNKPALQQQLGPCPGNERRSGKNHVSGHGVANDPETSPAAETDRETSPVEESDQERNLEGQETDLGVETSLGVESDQETSLGDEIDPEKNLGVEIIGPEKSLEVEIDPDLVKDVIGTTLGRVSHNVFFFENLWDFAYFAACFEHVLKQCWFLQFSWCFTSVLVHSHDPS